MTNRIWPVNAVNGTPQYAGRALRQTTVSPFVTMGNPARPLGALSGVRPGTPSTTAAASSTAWTCGPHAGILDVQTAAEAGAYTYSVDTSVSGALTPADTTYPRVDVVYVTISDPSEAGVAAPGVSIGYLAGIPNALPTAPAVPSQSMALFNINVPKVGGGSPTTTWVSPFVGAGSPPQFTTKALLDGWTTAAPQQRAFVIADPDTTLVGEYARIGAVWVGISSDTGWIQAGQPGGITFANSSWTNTVNAAIPWQGLNIRRVGRMVTISGPASKSTAYTSLESVGTVPVGMRPAVSIASYASTPAAPGIAFVRPDGTFAVGLNGAVGQYTFSFSYPV